MKFHSLALSALIVTFGESSFVPSSFQRNCIHCNNNAILQRSSKLHAYTLDDNKWESLGIDGEQEPQWYILNCMATVCIGCFSCAPIEALSHELVTAWCVILV